LCNSWQSATGEARQAIAEIQTTVSGTAETAAKAIKTFKASFDKTYHWILGILSAFGLVAGIMIGILIFDYFRPHTKTVYEIPNELLLLIESRQRERASIQKQKMYPPPYRELVPMPTKETETTLQWEDTQKTLLELNFLKHLPQGK
jgi:quinol-cytochrome oxidoreductase complex cytochrome b subunit